MLFGALHLDRIAVFVDAGYLFAQGSAAITGGKKPRASLALVPDAAIAQFKTEAIARAPDCKLLRIYWYDGAVGGNRPTTDQAALAILDDVKLRLGFVNSSGQQKGVDSLIVTDLIELARLKSISDALLLSGDEDVRVGVQIAQNYGVRVHLLGIAPSRGTQSQQLMHEADTTVEWSAETILSFLSLREDTRSETRQSEAAPKSSVTEPAPSNSSYADAIEATVDALVDNLSDSDLDGLKAYWDTERGVPTEFDRSLLRDCGAAVGRLLDPTEKKAMRSRFRERAIGRLGTRRETGTPPRA